VVGCGFFSALCGSGPATTAAIGTVTIPAMKKENYSNRFAGGIAAAGGALGTMIPPSNMLIMYALVAEESIPRLFLGGVVPGIVISLLLIMIVWFVARLKGFGGHRDSFNFRALLIATWRGKWAIGAPLLVLGGIYAGFFTPTEAAGVSVFYALFVGLVVHKELDVEKILEALKFTALFGGLLLILGPTIAFGQLITLYDIPIQVESILTAITTNPFFVLLLIGIFFMIVGMFMDSLAQIVIFTPVLLPVAKNIGVDPIFFGVFVALTCEIGFLTPPVGANLFVSARILDDKIEEMSIGVLPFALAYVIVLIAFCISQDWVVWLPNFFYGISK
ncbi:MAG: TRAP transporter large permease, partial [Deltaproteobacteria bacterium]|nr:TRAP transporter large permease [Deltaproteobacteria bacterium]